MATEKKPEVYGIWNDQQIPYHDRRALEVATQIFEDANLTGLVFNGDWGDYMELATHPKGTRDDLYESLNIEVQRQREELKSAMRRIKPKWAKWTDGNHEFRVFRACHRDPTLFCKLVGIKFEPVMLSSVREAISIPTLLGLDALGIKYAGGYPKGVWLKDGLSPEFNVYVQHGYTARKKSSHTVKGQMEDHWSSMVVGHCEKLAGPIWDRKMGRDYFGVENGNLSLIGEPGLGDSIYSGSPHADPKLLNHRQGISLIYWDSGHWWPFTIKIRDGKAWWNGKLYKA